MSALDPVALLREEMDAAGVHLEWADGRLDFVGPAGAVTPGMRAVFAAFAEELAEHVPRPSPARRLREWLWNSGHTSTEDESWGWADDYHPAGAWWWRHVGERDWKRTAVDEKWVRGARPPAA